MRRKNGSMRRNGEFRHLDGLGAELPSSSKLRARRRNASLVLAASGAAIALTSNAASAAIYTYTPANTSTDLWSAGTDWSSTPSSNVATELTFVGTNSTVLAPSLVNTNTIDTGNFTLNILDLQGTGPASGNATINISGNATNDLFFNGASNTINLNANNGATPLTYNVSVPIVLGTTSATFTGNGNAAFNFSGNISGAGFGITKSGTSTLNLYGANTYTGSTTVNGGTLLVGNGTTGSLTGGGNLKVNVGNITFNSNQTSTFNSSAFADNVVDYATGSATLTLTAGTVDINSPTSNGSTNYGLDVGSGGNGNGTVTVNGGTLNIQDWLLMGRNGGFNSATLTINNGGTVDIGYLGGYSGPGSTGNGTLYLSDAAASNSSVINLNTGGLLELYAVNSGGYGSFNFNGGTLQALGNNTIFFSGVSLPLVVQNGGAVINTNGFNVSISNALTHYAGGNASDGGLTKMGNGILTLTGNSSYNGNTTISAGELNVGLAQSANAGPLGNISANFINFNGGYLQYSSANTYDYSSRFSTAAGQQYNVDTNGQNVTWAGTLTSSGGSLTKIGNGNLTLTGNSSYNGNTTLSAGVVNVGFAQSANAGPLGNISANFINFNGGYLQYSSANTYDYSSRFSTAAGQQYNVDTNGQNVTWAGTLTSSGGSLTKIGNGNLTLSTYYNTFTGNISVSAGTLIASSGDPNVSNPTSSPFGNPQTANRTISVGPNGTVSFALNDVFGNAGSTPVVQLLVNGGTVNRNANFDVLGPITLQNGATLTGGNGVLSSYQGYQFTGTITVSGSSGSSITTTGTTNTGDHLEGNITFNVASTGAGPDLTVSAPLINQSGSLAPAGLIKTGNGTMVLTANNTFSGGATISAGTIRANSATSSLGTGAVTVYSGATLGGNGTVGNTASAVTIAVGGTITAGADATHNGILASGSQVWSGNGTYLWKISGVGTGGVGLHSGASGNITGGGGSGVEGANWDLINVTSGTLNLSGLTAASPFYIDPTGTISGNATNYSWVIAQAPAGGITLPTAGNYTVGQDLTNHGAGGAFVLSTSGLTDTSNGALAPSEFSLEAVNFTGHEDLVLDYTGTPEPGTTILLLGGAVPMLMGRRRRKARKNDRNAKA